MADQRRTSSLHKRQGEDTPKQTQEQTIFLYLSENVATASMASEATGIPQKNICRIKRDLEKRGLLWEVERKKCQHTGYKAWYITTNPEFRKGSNQLGLFDEAA